MSFKKFEEKIIDIKEQNNKYQIIIKTDTGKEKIIEVYAPNVNTALKRAYEKDKQWK